MENRLSKSASSRPPGNLSLADALFNTTQQRVLGLLFGQPQKSFYMSELIALAKVGSGSVQRELARLEHTGLVTMRLVGNQKYFQANAESPLYTELCSIIQKTTGLAEPLKAALQPLANRIDGAFVFGSVAKRQDTAASDVDLMIVSHDVGYSELFGTLEDLSQRLGRTVNPTIYTPAELTKRITRKDSFITRVLAQPKIWLIGDANVLGI